jgi:hypothetical protein
VVADAGDGLEGAAAESFDLIVWDLYDGPRAVTSSLTRATVERMGAVLSGPHGLLVLNVSDRAPFDVVRGTVAALQEVFADTLVLAEPSTLRGRRSGNCVVAAAWSDLPVAEIATAAAAAPVRGRVVEGANLVEFVADAPVPTDDAPLPPPDESRGRGFL